MLEAHTSFETPEGIRLRLHVAGPLPRALAWLIDTVIRVVFYILAGILLDQLGKFGDGIMLLIIFIGEWLYPTFFEAVKGATPGKQAMGLRVTMDDGTSLDWASAFARNLLRAVDFLPFMYLLGLVATLSNQQFKRLGDLLAGTIVVYETESPASSTTTEKNQLTPLALPFALTADEQKLILEFTDNNQHLSPSRQQEIANLLQPLLQQQDQQALTTIQQYAAWIRGEQK